MRKSKISFKNVLYTVLFCTAGVMYCLSFDFNDAGIVMPLNVMVEDCRDTESNDSNDEAHGGYSLNGQNKDVQASNEPAHVDINSASAEELTALPGIGDSKAQSIVEYRTSNGDFTCIEDIMKVPGIKEKVFAKIKDFIYIGEDIVHGEEGSDS